ncbi:MAG: hypothetical protein K2M68_08140, partial [Muribaculaceae bacterium]|nr:hypothetical protein [Muribaculaceae bacterium]
GGEDSVQCAAGSNVVIRFERVNMPWGYMDGDGHQHYYITVYQGNIRVVTDRSGNIEQITDYIIC